MKSRLASLWVVTTLFLILAPFAMASTTWYVDGVNGNDNNNCMTTQTACKTIGHAISLSASGDTIKVAAATYTEHLTISISLKLIGAGANTTIIDGGGGAGRVVTISIANANVTLSNVTIQNGRLVYFSAGGGIYNNGALTISRSTISGNSSQKGGGIYNNGMLQISNSTISQNVANGFCIHLDNERCFVGYGGGIYSPGGTVIVTNSTISGNFAKGGYGGGIAGGSPGTVRINNSTVSENVATEFCLYGHCFAGSGGGIWENGPLWSLTIQNSLVANSSSGGNCSGTITSIGYNLSSDGTCSFNGPGDMNNIDPNLGPLQNNGGPTQTMALLPGSPAIDAGDLSGCTDSQGHLLKTDQRGQPRPDKEDSGGCDMGAYESQTD